MSDVTGLLKLIAKLERQVGELIDEKAELRSRIETLTELLKEVQWGGEALSCPICDWSFKHAPDCRLMRALEEKP